MNTTTRAARSSRSGLRAVDPDTLLAYGRQRVATAAAALWPEASIVLGPAVPSADYYARPVYADGRECTATLSLLGVPLAHVMRGDHGPWPEVRERQEVYVRDPGSLLARQAAAYGVLRSAGITTPDVEPAEGGVLFTKPPGGRTLADMIVDRPHRSGDLLTGVLRETATLSRRIPAASAQHAALPEREIRAVFRREFAGGTPDGRLGEAVDRLRLLPAADDASYETTVLGLTPETVYVTGGAGRPVVTDPAPAPGHPASDTARLLSRLHLHVIATRPRNAARIIGGYQDTAFALARTTGAPDIGAWLRQLTVLWAMDTAALLHAVQTAPVLLPLPDHFHEVDRVGAVAARFVERIARALDAVVDDQSLWPLVLDYAAETVGR